MAEHFVELEVSGGGAMPQFRCTASDEDDVNTSPCRWYCIRSECEEGCVCEPIFGADGHLHPDYSTWTDHLEYCRFIEGWFDLDPWDLYEGAPTTVPLGAVDLRWQGETYSWRLSTNSGGSAL